MRARARETAAFASAARESGESGRDKESGACWQGKHPASGRGEERRIGGGGGGAGVKSPEERLQSPSERREETKGPRE